MIRELGVREYEPVWRRMQAFTEDRGRETPDECWLVQHPAVFTLGLNGKAEHLLDPHEIPVIAVDRGGQVTKTRLVATTSCTLCISVVLLELRCSERGSSLHRPKGDSSGHTKFGLARSARRWLGLERLQHPLKFRYICGAPQVTPSTLLRS